MVGKRPGRLTWKAEREIATHFGTYVETIERKAKALGVPIKRRLEPEHDPEGVVFEGATRA